MTLEERHPEGCYSLEEATRRPRDRDLGRIFEGLRPTVPPWGHRPQRRGGGEPRRETIRSKRPSSFILPSFRARVGVMALVIAAIPDVFFRAKVLETARALSVAVEVARDADELLQQVRAEKPRLILMDLQAKALQPLDTM